MTSFRPVPSRVLTRLNVQKSGKRTSGARELSVKVKTAKGRRLSSVRWLNRQLNDPYIAAARREGYRSRAAYKLLDLNHKYSLVRPGQSVVDLGAAPGGWTQVLCSLTQAGDREGDGQVFALDILDMEPLPHVTLLKHDFMLEESIRHLHDVVGGKVNGVFSDMAAPTTGNRTTDHLRTMGLCASALDYSIGVLKVGGIFVCKVFQGGTEHCLLDCMKKAFTTVKHARPPASRKESREAYVVCMGFKGSENKSYESAVQVLQNF